ncbi:MAG: RNase adapter RapZ, partial [Gammaproteobacteria bacterium]
MKLIIVTGLSGSGKSTALQALEDLGFYCIDNLPVGLLSAFAGQIISMPTRGYKNAAVSIDVRNLSTDLKHFPEVLDELKGTGLACAIFFLDANENILL